MTHSQWFVLPLRTVLAVYLTFAATTFVLAESVQDGPKPEIEELLGKLTQFSPDACGASSGSENDWHSHDAESPVFDYASKMIIQALNDQSLQAIPSATRASNALKHVEEISAQVNAAWPKENRFHFQVLDVNPALVVKMSLRTHARYFVFGVPDEVSGKGNLLWKTVGSDEVFHEKEVLETYLELFPLHRGPSRAPRFLAKFVLSGCAGSMGVAYDGREWDPQSGYDAQQIIDQSGASGLSDNVKGFEQIGELQTDGPLITLPYCWFSRIDTWDNPSLCAVDTYDLSGNSVKFRSRVYNRSDLLPVAKVIEYAQQRDYPAVLGYCGSPQVARSIVRDLPPSIFADDLRITRIGERKKRVTLGYDSVFRFDVEYLNGRWLVVAFSAK